MLTIAFVTSSLALFAAASPVQEQGISIALNKRSALAIDGIIDPDAVLAILERAISKYDNGFAAYEANTGMAHPLAPLLGTSSTNATDSSSSSSLHKRKAKPAPAPTKGSVPLTDENNGELWQGTLSIGTPAKPYTVQFDTGSSDLFVPGPTCSGCDGHTRFDPTKSSTAVNQNKAFTLKYGSGQTSGNQYSDTVAIAGYTATGQRLGVATMYSSSFSKANFPPDGLMGMAYQTISAFNAPPVFQSLLAQKQVATSVFSFKLATSGSELLLGGTNDNLYKGAFTYVPVTTQGYWQVKMDAVAVGSTTVLTNVASIIDTGTTLIIAPTAQVNAFYAAIPGSKDASSTYAPGFHTFPCATTVQPSLTFAGTKYPINPALFNLGRVSKNSQDCLGALVGTDSFRFWIVGDTFLQGVYSTFDLGNNRVGFAALK